MRFLFGTSLLFGLVLGSRPGMAADNLSPRAEVSVKGGSERSTLTTEFWVPLAQKSDRVVYADARLMGDDDDNREGNLGIGYRQIYQPTNSVLGIHGWIDRRRTEHNSTFHQITFGVESLGDKIDLRANGYVPLNGPRTVTLPNLGSATPYLAGNGLFYDTNGFVNETPQYGMDAEAGYRLPVFEKQIDTIRVFGGGYHFFRSDTENVTGLRIRTEATINKLISVGARFQHDGPRGSQGFLEATLRFPFSAKKLYQTDKLRSRLDESPERDIDIVTASKVDNGLRKKIINTTSGESQRIIYVDNTNTRTGDGTKENPFNNLKFAETALQANDILYIFHGDGTTHNMDQGITINQSGVQLIGSGSNLTINGYTFLNAGAAPILTNTQTSIDEYTGNGILVLGGNAVISGVTIGGATRSGIHAISESTAWQSFTISNITATHNMLSGIRLTSQNNGSFQNIFIDRNTMAQNAEGLRMITRNGTVNLVSITNNTVLDNGYITTPIANNGHGMLVSANSGRIETLLYENNYVSNSFSQNIAATADNVGSTIGSAIFRNNISENGSQYGYYIAGRTQGVVENGLFENNIDHLSNLGYYSNSRTNGRIDTLIYNNNVSSGNTSRGFNAVIQTGGIIDKYIMTNNTSTGAPAGGISFQVSNAGSGVNSVIVDNFSASNGPIGISFLVQSSSYINQLQLSNITTANNTSRGIYFFANGGTFGNIALNNAITINNGENIRVEAATATGIIGQVSISNTIANNAKNSQGITIAAGTGGTINQANLSNITANNNITYGVYVTADSSTIGQVNLNNVTANNNISHGIYALAQTATSVINGISLSNSNIIGNTGNGVYLNNNSVGAILNADLGGGGSSTGQNRIFGNTANDLNINRSVISATNNWWNNGGAAPTRVTLTNGGSATYTPPLATDPRP